MVLIALRIVSTNIGFFAAVTLVDWPVIRLARPLH
jgi:hypothetical protein